MKPVIGIDPGASGGLAWIDPDGVTHAEPMPEGMTGQADRIRALSAELPGAVAVIEKTGGYMPGNSGPGAVTFARHCGHLEAILYTVGVPTSAVAPGVWQRALGELPKEKADRKRAIRELMARRFPALGVTLKTADALGILCWAMDRKEARAVA
ncbi:MAG: hypothetical protein ACKOET_05460 [Verrucomicrobiota bacterium]